MYNLTSENAILTVTLIESHSLLFQELIMSMNNCPKNVLDRNSPYIGSRATSCLRRFDIHRRNGAKTIHFPLSLDCLHFALKRGERKPSFPRPKKSGTASKSLFKNLERAQKADALRSIHVWFELMGGSDTKQKLQTSISALADQTQKWQNFRTQRVLKKSSLK